MARISATAFAIGLALTPQALAQDAGDKPALALVCTNGGLTYQVGEFACLPACHEQRRLARCDAVSETASWTYVSDSCPSAMIIEPPWPSNWSAIPDVSAMSPIPVTVTYSAFPPSLPVTLAALLH